MTEADMIESLKVHQFQPGDKLVLVAKVRLTQDAAERIRIVAERWSGVPCVVFDEGMRVDVARGLGLPLPEDYEKPIDRTYPW